MPEQWCDVFLRVVCATPTDGFPFWEVIVSVIVTGAVTWLTIWASIRGARRETERTIQASLASENRARQEREQESARLADEEAYRQRIVLSAALSRGVHLMQAVRELPADDRTRMEAEAEWSALRVSFKVSTAPYAADVYDFADLRIDHARSAGPPPKSNRVETFLEFAKRTTFADEVSDAASYWAEHAALESKVAEELAELRLAREQRSQETTAELIRMMKEFRDSPPAEEADIFAEDPEGR